MLVKQEITSAELQEAYVNGQRVFEGVEIIGGSEYPLISDMDLHEARFVNCWFHSTTFRYVNLCGSTFLASNPKCVTFEKCNLSDSTWDDCAVCSMEMRDSLMSGIKVGTVDGYGCRMEGVTEIIEYAVHNPK